MKIICAGFPKTGSKSCSSALRKLVFTVADILESMEYLSEVWLNYATDKGTIQNVIDEYDKNGFDTNQDLPGNLHWEALYKASPPGTKVILTVRDDDEQWYNSWKTYMTQGKLSFFRFQAETFSELITEL